MYANGKVDSLYIRTVQKISISPRPVIHFHISCKLCVLLMPRKNKPQNSFTFRVNVNPAAKWCKMQKAKKVTGNTPLYTFCFSHLYTYGISHFEGISRVFLWNTPQITKHSLHNFHISFKFFILLMSRKHKL